MVSHSDSLSLRKIPSKDKIKDFSKKVLDETRELKNPRKLDNLPDIVILSRTVVAQLLESVFLSNFDGLNVLKKKSILEGKEGEKLFSDNFNLTDSGVLDEGFGSQSFDMEGIPSQETLLVKEGVLKSFLYDYNTAKHLNKESTGNSVGGGVGLNNILVGKGEGINLDKAIIIKDIIGAHTGNELTTEFSVKSSGTLLLEKGQKKAIKDVMINGKMIDMLNNIVGIGKKIRNVGNFYLPRMAFKSMNVSNL